MLLDLNECPLCGGRKTDTDFCDACTAEIEEAARVPKLGVLQHLARALAASKIASRNGRFALTYQRAREQAARRSERWTR